MCKNLKSFFLRIQSILEFGCNNKILEKLSAVKYFPDALYFSSCVQELIYRKCEKNLYILNNPLDIFIFKKEKPFNVCHLP